jgi:hypothetical protein
MRKKKEKKGGIAKNIALFGSKGAAKHTQTVQNSTTLTRHQLIDCSTWTTFCDKMWAVVNHGETVGYQTSNIFFLWVSPSLTDPIADSGEVIHISSLALLKVQIYIECSRTG